VYTPGKNISLTRKKERKGEVKDYEPVKLVIAKPGEELKRWRAYAERDKSS